MRVIGSVFAACEHWWQLVLVGPLCGDALKERLKLNLQIRHPRFDCLRRGEHYLRGFLDITSRTGDIIKDT